jgi:hypothetical protein
MGGKQMLIESEVNQANQIRNRLQRQLDMAMGNRDLNLRARNRIRATAILDARSDMAALRAASDAREQEAFSKAYREAFGLDQARSAEDRALRAELAAANLGPSEARTRMTQALAIGDTLQARALAAVAWEHQQDEMGGRAWNDVLADYSDSSPNVERQMANLVIFSGTGNDKIARFQDKLYTEVPQPSDLPGNLDYLASDAETETAPTAWPVGSELASWGAVAGWPDA